jgi:hypothetical protein
VISTAARARAALVLALLVALTVPASAQRYAMPAPSQVLRRLHVDALSMRADRTRLQVGQVFHLAIHVRVREHVQALDELLIPDLGTMQSLGDERHTTHGRAGTDVVETLTLEPTASGPFTFQPAYLDAIDARTGRPSRFSSNPVTVVVEGPSRLDTFAADLMRAIERVALFGLGLIVLVVLMVALARRIARRPRRVRKPAPAPAAPPARAPKRLPREAVADALRGYRVTPSAAQLLVLRGALFAAAGVSSGATLRDALAQAPDHVLRVALLAAERGAFGPEYQRDAASLELVDATEAWLR